MPEPMRSLIGKLEAGALTNFFGGPGTGKTNVCLLAALECVKKGGKVVYIDTEGGFSFERLKQLTKNPDEALKSIDLIEPKTFKDQGLAMKLLDGREADLIIMDSAVALYRLEHGESEDEKGQVKRKSGPSDQILEANRELSKQISILSNIARTKKIPVLITTHTFRNWDTGISEIVGGDSIKYWSKVIVFLEKTGKTSERKALLTKHRYMPEGGSVNFLIVQEGIKPSKFKLF